MSKSFLDGLDNECTKYDLAVTAQFRKDYKLAKKRGLKMEALAEIVTLLAKGEALPEKNRDHSLSGNWIGHRECHVLPDWLLIYRIEENVLVLTLTRTGTHSDLLDK
jgi:mRNA interferase YafQ